MHPTERLAEFVVTTDRVPEWVLDEAKRTLVNILAVSISASTHPSARALIEWARAESAAPRATVLGDGLRTSPALAAQVNGFLAHLQDYDDTHLPTVLPRARPSGPPCLPRRRRASSRGGRPS